MELQHWLLVLQVFLLGLQIGSGITAMRKGIAPIDYWYGYPVWGCVPIIAIMFIIQGL